MKSILISIKPKWCALMMNGDKTVEVRKGTALYKAIQKLIDEYGFAQFYVYCSKISRKHYHLIESIDTDTGKSEFEIDYYIGSGDYLDWCFDGKVAFKFRCYKVEEINKYPSCYKINGFYYTPTLSWDKLERVSCLSFDELNDYLKGKTGCAIHISNLEIFDKPKELSGGWFAKRDCGTCPFNYEDMDGDECIGCMIEEAPHSWCYVESEELL